MFDKLPKSPLNKDPLTVLTEVQRNITYMEKEIRGVENILTTPNLEAARQKLHGENQQHQQHQQQQIRGADDLVAQLRQFKSDRDLEKLKGAWDWIMRNDNCEPCRTMISAALSEFGYGNYEKADDLIDRVIEHYMTSEKEGEGE